MNLTKTVLKRPVTTVMVILCLIVFGLTSVFSSKLELIPSMDMPMLIVMATYPGASPDDVDQLVVQPIEDETGTLTGIKGVTSVSNENYGIVLLEYDYGTDIDSAYDLVYLTKIKPWEELSEKNHYMRWAYIEDLLP